MSKFHLNDKGEAGQCRAEKGGCPFGGEAQHYSSTEKARTAYEASMAAEQIPTTVKKTADSRGAKAFRPESPKLPLSRDEFDPALHDDFEYDDVFFDEQDVREGAYLASTAGESHDPVSEDDLLEMAQIAVDRKRAAWENWARTEPARSFEKNVPLRLIPADSTVQIQALTEYGGRLEGRKVERKIGQPVFDEGEDRWVGRYANSHNEWKTAEPYDTFDTSYVPLGGKLNPSWDEENEIAKRLAAVRATYTEPDNSKSLTHENYDPKDWDGVSLMDLKFDGQLMLDRAAEQGVSEEKARAYVERKKKNWEGQARTEIASSNEDGVPARLVPVGAEVATSDRDSSGKVKVGKMMAPVIRDDAKVIARVRAGGMEMGFESDEIVNVGFIPDGNKLSPFWKKDNEKAAKIKEQRARVAEFEKRQK
jgi:hypothetical protein